MDPLLGDDPVELGPYSLQGRLGSGGMGTVYLGRSQGGRLVAVKTVHEWLARDPEFRTRFEREVDAARRVNGLYTAQVVDADPHAATPWMATRYINGPSVAERVSKHGPLTVSEVVALAGGVSEALSSIHAAGLVHRDLKPSNVILADDGPHVIDFGVAQARDLPGLTGTGKVLGTFEYMAPEQIENGVVGPLTDVFALGGLLYFAATGAAPFGTGSAGYLINQVVHGQADLSRVPDQRLRDLVARCLAKNADDRPTTAAIVQAAASIDATATVGPGPLGSSGSGQAGPGTGPTPPAPADPRTPSGPGAPGQSYPTPSQSYPTPGQPYGAPSQPSPAPRPSYPTPTPPPQYGRPTPPPYGPPPGPQPYGTPSGPHPYGPPQAGPQYQAPGRQPPYGTPPQQFYGLPTPLPGHPGAPARAGTAPGSGASRRALIIGAGAVAGLGVVAGVGFAVRALIAADPVTPTDPTTGKTPGSGTPGASQVLADSHTETCLDVVFLPDGKSVLTTCSENVFSVDVATGKYRQAVNSGSGSVYAVSLRPDSPWIALGCSDGSVEFHDASSGKLIRMLNAVHKDQVNAIDFSPDGTRLATASSEGTSLIIDPEAGSVVATLTSNGSVTDVCYAPDGKRLVTTTAKGNVQIWDAATGKAQRALAGHTGQVWSACFSPDGKYVLTAGEDTAARIYDASTGAVVRTLSGHTLSVNSVAVSPDGSTVATASSDGTARIWTLATGAPGAQLHGHDGVVQQVAWSKDGKTVATTGADGTVRLWEPSGRQISATTNLPSVPWELSIGPDGSVATVGGTSIRIADPRSASHLRTLTSTEYLYHAQWSPDGKLLAGTADKILYLWDAVTGTLSQTVQLPATALCIAWTPDSTRIAVGDNAGAVGLFDPADGSSVKTVQVGAKDTRVRAIWYAPDGKRLAVATGQAKLQLWDVVNGRALVSFQSTAYVVKVRFLKDGRLVTGNESGKINIWDVTTGRQAREFSHPTGMMYGLAISPDGATIAAGGSDGVIKLWSVSTGQARTLSGHSGRILELGYTPDGRYLASVSGDATARVWDVSKAK